MWLGGCGEGRESMVYKVILKVPALTLYLPPSEPNLNMILGETEHIWIKR